MTRDAVHYLRTFYNDAKRFTSIEEIKEAIKEFKHYEHKTDFLKVYVYEIGVLNTYKL